MDKQNQKDCMIARPDYQKRQDRIRSEVDLSPKGALIITDLYLIRYLCGFAGSDGALLINQTSTFLLIDGRYTTQAQGEATVSEIIEHHEKIAGIVSASAREGFNELCFDPAAMTLEQYLTLKDKLPNIELTPIKNIFGAVRIQKDADEIAAIRRAAQIASSAFTNMVNRLREGIEERDLALELDYQIRSAGAETTSFSTIVASGPNSALPHAKPGRRRLASGDFIIFDYGATYQGYCSDETCTIALGPVSPEQRLVYGIVKEAHDKGLDKIKPGISGRDIDRIVRSHIQEKGYDAFFGHATGHGVGLEVHEVPRLSQISDTILQPGMVVTVEPGIYLPGKWGVRIEDLVVVTEYGCEILSQISKELTVISG